MYNQLQLSINIHRELVGTDRATVRHRFGADSPPGVLVVGGTVLSPTAAVGTTPSPKGSELILLTKVIIFF